MPALDVNALTEALKHLPGWAASRILTHSTRSGNPEWVAQSTAIDHGSIGGLTDDDHTQYLKEKASGGTAAEVPTHTHANAGEAGTVAHGDLTGVTANQHHNQSHGASDHTDRTRTKYIDAGSLQPGTRATGASLITQGSNTRFNAWQLDAAAAEESVLGGFQIPQDYASGFTVKLILANAGAGSGNVVMLTVVKNAADGTDLNSTSGESVVQNTFAAGTQDVEKVYTTTVSLTPAAGDYIRLIVGRNGSDGSDTLGNDIGLVGVIFEYTADM